MEATDLNLQNPKKELTFSPLGAAVCRHRPRPLAAVHDFTKRRKTLSRILGFLPTERRQREKERERERFDSVLL